MAIVIPFGVSDKRVRDQIDPEATRTPNGPRSDSKTSKRLEQASKNR
jgi:hypothetical protein